MKRKEDKKILGILRDLTIKGLGKKMIKIKNRKKSIIRKVKIRKKIILNKIMINHNIRELNQKKQLIQNNKKNNQITKSIRKIKKKKVVHMYQNSKNKAKIHQN
jgi:hypothetical protein